MPTGYTASVADGDVTDFRTFAMRCARGMGALITMRDDPWDASIPDEFQPSSYHETALDKAQESLADARSWSTGEASQRAAADHFSAVREAADMARRDGEKRRRYEAMLNQVEAWEPPTPDHNDFKKFMVEQLQESIRFDCGHTWNAPALQDGEVYRQAMIAKAERDIAYHAKGRAEENERAKGRTEWVRALRRSLPQADRPE